MLTTDMQSMIIEEAKKYDVPISLALAIAKVSSNFRPDLIGQSGEKGVMQIHPDLAESGGARVETIWDPRKNIETFMKIISRLLGSADGDWEKTINILSWPIH